MPTQSEKLADATSTARSLRQRAATLPPSVAADLEPYAAAAEKQARKAARRVRVLHLIGRS